MRDEGLIGVDEPFDRLLTQGMVLAETYYRDDPSGRRLWFNPSEVEVHRDAKGGVSSAVLVADGKPVNAGGVEKMAKSKNNGVDPQALVDQYGADTVRLFSMFAAPPEQSLEWSEAGVEGSWRFLRRFWSGVCRHVQAGLPEYDLNPESLSDDARDLRRVLHETIAKVSDDFARRLTFNTAIAAVMECCNRLARFQPSGDNDRALVHECWASLVRLIAPVTPHLSEALWKQLGGCESVFDAGWPIIDESALARQAVTIVVQVNGKVRGRIEAAPGSDRGTLEQMAQAEANVARFIADKTVRKVIVVPDKLVNIVVG
jgi:leucyl-tRNA synthetase